MIGTENCWLFTVPVPFCSPFRSMFTLVGLVVMNAPVTVSVVPYGILLVVILNAFSSMELVIVTVLVDAIILAVGAVFP